MPGASNTKNLVIGGAVVLILVVAGFWFYGGSNSGQPDSTNSQTRIQPVAGNAEGGTAELGGTAGQRERREAAGAGKSGRLSPQKSDESVAARPPGESKEEGRRTGRRQRNRKRPPKSGTEEAPQEVEEVPRPSFRGVPRP